MKLIKTDHYEQSLALDPRSSVVIRTGLEAMLNHAVGTPEMRDQAMDLLTFLRNKVNEDQPALFHKSHGRIINCPDCNGSGKHRLITDEHTEESQLHPCHDCKGEGQLYMEYTRKLYAVNEYHRQKLAR